MKNVIKSFAFASMFFFFAACKNEKPAADTATAIAATTTDAATATAAATTVANTAATAATTTAAVTEVAKAVPAAAAAVKSAVASATDPTTTKVEPSTANVTPAPPVVAGGKTTSAKFDETSHDWGTIAEGEKMIHIFKFKNTGGNDMIISDAHGSCGCTVPEWPKEPIKPGKSSQIKVIFDSKGKPGDQSKSVTITANTEPSNMVLMIKGKVTPKEEKK
ncbi:MAG: DUF1573 domain-containing protein [Saprospiraceae bacterium]|nr:DUF1573 domain-containing protein [Saprospiraceae bacterium]